MNPAIFARSRLDSFDIRENLWKWLKFTEVSFHFLPISAIFPYFPQFSLSFHILFHFTKLSLYFYPSQKSVQSHRGLIESSSILLVALSQNYTPSPTGDPIIRNLFKSIVYCEPNVQSLCHLSEFLVIISSGNRMECCNNLCCHETNNVTSYNRYGINRFSYDTCPLQIFACLLQIAIQPTTGKISASEQQTLIVVSKRLMLFLRQCFERPVEWLFRKGTQSGATSIGGTTEHLRISLCYCYMVTCTIVLLHMCIKEWIEDHSRIGKYCRWNENIDERRSRLRKFNFFSHWRYQQMRNRSRAFSKWAHSSCTTTFIGTSNRRFCKLAASRSKIDFNSFTTGLLGTVIYSRSTSVTVSVFWHQIICAVLDANSF